VFRRTTDRFVALIFATVLIGLSAQARSAVMPQQDRAPAAGADPSANDPHAGSIPDLLRSVQQARDEVRKLRGDIEKLRKLLEAKPQSNPAKPTTESSHVYRVKTAYVRDGDKKVMMFYVMPVVATDDRRQLDKEPLVDEILRSLPQKDNGFLASVSKTERKNIRVDVKKIADSTGDCKFYPLVGNARLKKCQYKCTVSFDKTTRSDWPIPFMNVHPTREVVYIDRDQLIRCADSDAPEKHKPH
jgi:hypothetical protein